MTQKGSELLVMQGTGLGSVGEAKLEKEFLVGMVILRMAQN